MTSKQELKSIIVELEEANAILQAEKDELLARPQVVIHNLSQLQAEVLAQVQEEHDIKKGPSKRQWRAAYIDLFDLVHNVKRARAEDFQLAVKEGYPTVHQWSALVRKMHASYPIMTPKLERLLRGSMSIDEKLGRRS